MPKERQTCTRCSQRRQKCDRKAPCTRCVRNGEGHLCTTRWTEGYDATVHRKYPKKHALAAARSPENSIAGAASIPTPSSDASERNVNVADATQNEVPELHSFSFERFLAEKDAPPEPIHDQVSKYQPAGFKYGAPTSTQDSSCFSPAAKAVESMHIQSLLPPMDIVLRIVDYYDECMLYWAGGIYHGPTFRKKLLLAYGPSQSLNFETLNWRWAGLLFAILSSSMISSPAETSSTWGFPANSKVQVSRKWGSAAVTCLNLGNYTSQYDICSVHAIYVLHAFEHLAGSTNRWAAMKSVATIIAKGIGLHRLGPHPDDDRYNELNAEQKEAWVEREIGRRTWYHVASQDWLCSTSIGSFWTTISRNFQTIRPRSINDKTFAPSGGTSPTFPDLGVYFFDYATLLVDFQQRMTTMQDDDDQTRFGKLIQFDGELRTGYIQRVPKCLSPSTPIDPSWPRWVPWARRFHRSSYNHKIIMLHQTFWNKSFKDVRYTYSRWACTTAATELISLYDERAPDEPQWWVEQAFIVAAGICLVVDLIHRPETANIERYQSLAQKAITYLQQFDTSSVATHGIRILTSLLQEFTKKHAPPPQQQQQQQQPISAQPNQGVAFPGASTNIPSTITASDVPQAGFYAINHVPQSSLPMPFGGNALAPLDTDFSITGFEDLMDYLPVEGGFDNGFTLDGVVGMATFG